MAFQSSQSKVMVQAYHLGIRHAEEFLESKASLDYIACTIPTRKGTCLKKHNTNSKCKLTGNHRYLPVYI